MRKYHRWISSICMLFLGWVSITGGLLALDELMPPPAFARGPDLQVLPGTRSTAPLPSMGDQGAQSSDPYTATRLRLHNLLKRLHTGEIVGLSGQFLDVATGVAFMVLSVTGIVMYFQMLLQRRDRGRPEWFWR